MDTLGTAGSLDPGVEEAQELREMVEALGCETEAARVTLIIDGEGKGLEDIPVAAREWKKRQQPMEFNVVGLKMVHLVSLSPTADPEMRCPQVR